VLTISRTESGDVYAQVKLCVYSSKICVYISKVVCRFSYSP